MKRIVMLVMLVAACTIQQQPAGDQQQATLAGAWRGQVRFTDGPFTAQKDLEFLYAFNAGGTMTESSNYDEAQPVTPAYGVWRQTAPNRFEARYVYYNTRPPAQFKELSSGGGWMPAGRGVLDETITLAADGKTYESTIAMTMFDTAGKPAAGGGHAKVHAVRIEF